MIWLARKVSTRRGAIGTSTPVFGLRPTRSPLSRRMKLPKPDIFTFAPSDRAEHIWCRMRSTMAADSARDRPISRCTTSARSARVKVPAFVFLATPASAIPKSPPEEATNDSRASCEVQTTFANQLKDLRALFRAPSQAHDGGTPGEATAHRFEHHQIALFQTSVAHRLIKRKRHRGGRGVGMLVNGHDHLVGRKAELPRRCV